MGVELNKHRHKNGVNLVINTVTSITATDSSAYKTCRENGITLTLT